MGAIATATAALLAGCGDGGLDATAAAARLPADSSTYPKLAIYWLGQSNIRPDALARYELIILDMEWVHRDPAALRRIKKINPRAKILAYFTAQEITEPSRSLGDSFPFRREMRGQIKDAWWLRDDAGNRTSFYPGTLMLNPASGWGPYLERFMATRVLSTGLVHGVFYDNA